MMKRIVCALAAIMVLTSSVFAWDAYSFTGVYDIASVSAPVLYSSNSSDILDVANTLPTSCSSGFYVYTNHYTYTSIPTTGFYTEMSVWEPLSSQIPMSPHWDQGFIHFVSNFPVSYQADTSDNTDKTYGLAAFCNSTYHPVNYTKVSGVLPVYDGTDYYLFQVDYDVSSYQSSAFSMDGLLGMSEWIVGPTVYDEYTQSSVDVLVNNQLVRSFSGSGFIDFAGYVYSGSSQVNTISFLWRIPLIIIDSESDSYNGSYTFWLRYLNSSSTSNSLVISFLSGESVLDGFNDEAQNDINSHESIESQWTNSMSSNFDALDMDNFSFPSGLVSGFGLITGIFQDLWNGMGEYKILYVFPLTLGVALLLIGRISKFSGGQSSSKSDRGNDDA